MRVIDVKNPPPPATTSYNAGPKSAAPNDDMNGASSSDTPSSTAGSSDRSNCRAVRSGVASVIDTGIGNVFPTLAVAEQTDMTIIARSRRDLQGGWTWR
jgi:hypothetical protein